MLFIRVHGYQNLFARRCYTRLDAGEHTCCTMGAPAEETILINSKRFAPVKVSAGGHGADT